MLAWPDRSVATPSSAGWPPSALAWGCMPGSLARPPPTPAFAATCASTGPHAAADRDGRAAAAGGRAPLRAVAGLISAPACTRRRCWSGRGAGLPAADRPGPQLYLDALRATPLPAGRRRSADARRPRALVQWQLRVPGDGCRPTTSAAALASWRCSRVVRAARVRRHLDRCPAAHLAARATAGRQRAGAAARGRAPRLDAAQPDGLPADPNPPASSTSRTRCAARSPTTWPRCCATPSSAGTRSAEIDWAVRWWEQARRAGLPLGDDFGTTSASSGARSNGWACSAI
jgi:hypothetical protein